jgi:hypothetical protein
MFGIAESGSTKRVYCAASVLLFFRQRRIERAAGLAPHPDGKHLLISFGVGEDEAWLSMVDAGDIRSTLENADHIYRREAHEIRSNWHSAPCE